MTYTSRRGALPVSLAATFAIAAPIVFGAGAAALAAEDAPDSTAPVTTFNATTTPPSGWFRYAQPVRLVATDAGSGVQSVFYSVNGGLPVKTDSHDVSLTLTAQGVNEVTVWAVDAAGNTEEPTTYTTRIDTIAPAIEVATPTSLPQGEPAVLDFTCTDAASGVAECAGNVADGAELDTRTPGEHEVSLSSVDVAGNLTSTTFTYTVLDDLEGPTMAMTLPAAPASGWYTERIALEMSATDPAGVGEIGWRAEGAQSSTGASTDARASLALEADGVTTVTAWAVDGLGNRGADATSVVRIDTTDPVIRILTPDVRPAFSTGDPVYVQGEPAPFVFECVDATSGVRDCSVDGADRTSLPTSTVGSHLVRIDAVDEAGNTSAYLFGYDVVAAPVDSDPDTDSDSDPKPNAGDAPAKPVTPRGDSLAHTGADDEALAYGGMAVVALLASGLSLMLARRKPARH